MNTLNRLLATCALTLLPVTEAFAGDVLEGALMSGSERLLAWSLLDPRLPAVAKTASAKILTKSGYGMAPGVTKSDFRIRPFLRYDGNLNGGMPGDSLSIGPFTFKIPEDYQAVSGALVGVSAEAIHVQALGNGLSMDLHGGISLGVSPETGLQKHQAMAEGCLRQMVSADFFVHGCLMAGWQKWDLGESVQVSARAGATHLFALGKTRNQITAELRQDYFPSIDGSEKSDQMIGSVELLSALPDGSAVSLEVEVGEKMTERSALRHKISAGYTRKIAGQPTSISLSWQENEGGMFLGEPRRDEIISASIKRPVGESMLMTVGVSRTDSTADILDNLSVDVGFSWKF